MSLKQLNRAGVRAVLQDLRNVDEVDDHLILLDDLRNAISALLDNGMSERDVRDAVEDFLVDSAR